MNYKAIEAKLRTTDPNYDAKNKQFRKVVREVFSKIIYLTPEVYKFLLGLKLAVPEEKLKKLVQENKIKETDIYIVYTRLPVGNKMDQASFKTTKDIGKAIKKILKNSPQLMFPPAGKFKFEPENNRLLIKDIPIPIKKGTARFTLCQFMFGGEHSMPWDPYDIAAALGNDPEDDHDWYSIAYGKIRLLNKVIEKELGDKNFIISENGQFTINPLHLTDIS